MIPISAYSRVGAQFAVGLIPAFFAAMVVVIQGAFGPILYTDEAGYLGTAVHFSNRSDFVALEGLPFYAPGYSLLLTPLISITAIEPWLAGVVVNVACVLLLSVAAQRLALRFGYSTLASYLLGTAVALTPSTILQVPRAWPETSLGLLVLLWVFSTFKFSERPTVYSASVGAFLSLAIFASHSRLLALLVSWNLLVLLVAFRRNSAEDRPSRLRALTASTSLSIIGFVLIRALQSALTSQLYGNRNSIDVTSVIFDNIVDPSSWPTSLASSIGQVWALIAGTFGLALVGIVSLAVGVRKSDHQQDLGKPARSNPFLLPERIVFLAFAMTSGITGLFLGSFDSRVDFLIYERYLAPFAPTLVLFAILGLTKADLRGVQRLFFQLSPLLGSSLIAIQILRVGRNGFVGHIQKLNIPALLGLQFWRDAGAPFIPSISVLQIGLVSAIIGLIIVWLISHHRRVGMAALSMMFVLSSSLSSGFAMRPFVNFWAGAGADLDRIDPKPTRVVVADLPNGDSRALVQLRLDYPEFVDNVAEACDLNRALVLKPVGEETTLSSEVPVLLSPMPGQLVVVDC